MLELKNITKDYIIDKKPFRALNGVSLKFSNKGFCSILGPSGCGKTTLLNIIGGLDRYTTGDLIFDNISTTLFKDSDWDNYRNKKIGFVFQSYNLIQHLSILENVELSLVLDGKDKKERTEYAKKALNAVGLEGIYNKKPNQLSGGQQQRVAIARALINDPEIILADEPTGALDSKTSVQVMEILKKISQDKLVIMVTHNNDLAAQYSTRIIKLHDGLVVEDKNVEEEKPSIDTRKNMNKKTSMSFFTALKMSFRNLNNKKGRTISTAIASSFGIIGIALVLALSNGFNGYIGKVETETASTLPINVASLIQYYEKTDESLLNPKYPEDDLLRPEVPTVSEASTYKKSNINQKYFNFLEYLKNEKEILNDYVINYNSYYSMNLVTEFGDNVKIVDNSTNNSMTEVINSYLGVPTTPFHALFGEEEYISNSYEVIYGEYPDVNNPHEVVLVVDSMNQIPFSTLQTLGIYDSTYENAFEANKHPISFEDILDKKYKLIPNTELYTENTNNDLPRGKNYYTQNNIEEIFNDDSKGIELKITGILRPKQGSTLSSMTPGLCYQKSLMEEFDNENMSSNLVENVKKNYVLRNDSETSLNLYKQSIIDLVTSEEFGNNLLTQFNTLNSLYLKFYSNFSENKEVLITTYMYEIIKSGADLGINDKNLKLYSEDLEGAIEDLFALYKEGKIDEFYNQLIEFICYINSYSKIRSVIIFPKDLSSKDELIKSLDEYNNLDSELDEKYHAISENEKVYYLDYVSELTDSLSQMINVISIVLIIFASISLVVSSVMTSIITYVSVIERTKEIGVLRALGARKKDVGRLFKAECVIIGALSGVIGVVFTYLVSFPINIILSNVFPEYNLGSICSLNVVHALLLVVLSIVLSYFSGLIPARAAAKKDPVKALRTE